MLSLIILLSVFILIAVRHVASLKLQIWQIMLVGALGVLATGQIPPEKALKSINPDVMLFLLGMFIVGEALEESGYLSHLSYNFFSRARSPSRLILYILFGMGLLSAFLMNDTLAIIGTPVVLSLAKETKMQPRILLLALAFAITTGSVMSPIGNPQNLLISVNGSIANPFITFLKFLFVPTVINLFLAYLLLRLFYRKHFHNEPLAYSKEPIKDGNLAILSKASLILLITLVVAKITMVFLGLKIDFRLTYIALICTLPIVLFSPKRFSIIMKIDWSTMVFFAAMFIVMDTVWDSGFFQSAINATHWNLTSTDMILGVSVLLSQLISNVPLVALYLPILIHLGVSTKELMALAVGSTIAGNLSILGAASNVIIIQNAEKRAGETLTFLEFVKVGVPLTILNVTVYWLYLYFM